MPDGLTLILGGAASGKSAYAEAMVLGTTGRATYIATAQAFDDEMAAKIATHRARRGAEWTTVDAPHDLAGALNAARGDPVLVDCVTLWLSNHLLAGNSIADETDRLCTALATCRVPVVAVTNEVGQGIVPDSGLGRQFREAQGRLNIRLAAQADLVVQVVAGLPNVLKGTLP
ncbi:MAG: bifunctional adenosylcobinamide kinase/adenosylcobinamide-phosphate guanylyltransferase [Marinibacterium sp.]